MSSVDGTPAITVIVPTRDRAAMLDECLKSIAASARASDELIVVDSASKNDETRSVAIRHGFEHLRCDRPGASLARNLGWNRAHNELIAFVDDDVRVSQGWADALRKVFDEHPEAAFVTGRIELPLGQEDTDRPVALMARPESMILRNGVHETPGHSANLAVRRAALADIGGFDEMLGAGAKLRAAEDADLIDRLYAAGFTGRYDTSVLAWHDQWRSVRQLVRLDFSYGIGAGARVAKLFRTNRIHAFKAGAIFFWSWGLTEMFRKEAVLRLCALARILSMPIGFVRGLLLPLEGGRFTPRARAR